MIEKLTGDSVIVNGVEYTLLSTATVATIDGGDTSVGDKLAKGDYVTLVFDTSGDDKNITGAFILVSDVEAPVVLDSSVNSDAAVKNMSDGLYVPQSDLGLSDMAGTPSNNLVFKFLSKDANINTTLTITNAVTDEVVYTESNSGLSAGGHFFYVNTKAGTTSKDNAGTGAWKSADAVSGAYSYTIVAGSDVLLEGTFAI